MSITDLLILRNQIAPNMQNAVVQVDRVLKPYPSSFYFVLTLLASLLFSQHLKGQIPPDFSDQSVVTGLNQVEGFVFDENGRAYLWEKGGVVKILDTTGVYYLLH